MPLMFLQTCAQSEKKASEVQKNAQKENVKKPKQTTQETTKQDKPMGLGLVMFHCM